MKKNSAIQKIPQILISLGIIILIIGLYYEWVKAGIPYQDPTPELTQRYLNYLYIGYLLYKIGFIIEIIGFVIFIMQKIFKKVSKASQSNK
jgi:flagellar biogenesis protein FliO